MNDVTRLKNRIEKGRVRHILNFLPISDIQIF